MEKREKKRKESVESAGFADWFVAGLWDLEDILNLHQLKLETCNLNEIFGLPLG